MVDVFPFDEPTRIHLARLLYRALPVYYRVQDEPPRGKEELLTFLRVLAAPLATLRQNIDELHANLFVDTCRDEALPLLASLIGVDLLFPDADTNRRDLRGMVSRRKRKGTRPMLEELGTELTGQLTVLDEGWQRLNLVQDLNQIRPERVIANVRPLSFGASVTGPLDTAHHYADVRAITATTGRYHPKHITLWVHQTVKFPLGDGTPRLILDGVPAPDERREWRYSFDPTGRDLGLRQRPTHDEDRVRGDRILREHFGWRPADFFDVDGRFSVRVAGLPAAVAPWETPLRTASVESAGNELAQGAVTIDLLSRPRDGWNAGDFELAVCMVDPQPLQVQVRATILLGAQESQLPNPPEPIPAGHTLMLRLTPQTRPGGYTPDLFPGAIVLVTGGEPEAVRASTAPAPPTSPGDLSLPAPAQQGYLRGSLVIQLPRTRVYGERWFLVAADGSVYDAQSGGSADPNETTPDLARLRSTGPSAAWPPITATASAERFTAATPTRGHGPVVMHGGRVLQGAGGEVAETAECALVFAMRYFDGGEVFRPVGALTWEGPNPGDAEWHILDNEGQKLKDSSTPSIRDRLEELAGLRRGGLNDLTLVVRFECTVDAVFVPSEVAWPADDGNTTLIYLPELLPDPSPVSGWPATLGGAPLVSYLVEVHIDGSTHRGSAVARYAEGQIAPLRSPAAHLRRQVTSRQLADENVPGDLGDNYTQSERCLFVDVERGRFSLNGEAPQPWPPGPSHPAPTNAAPPPNVTVAFQDGYSAHIGARPAPRNLVLVEEGRETSPVRAPTRLVSRSGVVHHTLDETLYGIPIYPSLNAAFAAVQASPTSDEVGEEGAVVIQFEDDATYPAEALGWPVNTLPGGDPIRHLILQAVDSRRPVLELTAGAGTSGATYESLTLQGIALGGASFSLPPCAEVTVRFCTVTDHTSVMTLSGTTGVRRIWRSVLGPLQVSGAGTLEIEDSVLDAGNDTGSFALLAPSATVTLQGVTTIGTVGDSSADPVFRLRASECLFVHQVFVGDHFNGCVRYSAVPEGSILPRRHEVFVLADGESPAFVSWDRHDPAHARLSEDSPSRLRTRGEDGSEVGVFNHIRATQRLTAFRRRLAESTPAGLVWGLLRVN